MITVNPKGGILLDGKPYSRLTYKGVYVTEIYWRLVKGEPNKYPVRTHNSRYRTKDIREGNLYEMEYRPREFKWTARSLAKLRRLVNKGVTHDMLRIAFNCSSFSIQIGLGRLDDATLKN